MIDWVTGDTLGLELPAHSASLQHGGEEFLTRAFRAIGAISSDNSVSHITQLEECPGGSTGRKLLLSVQYQLAAPELHTELFVKFSRDFDDEIRDRARIQMEREVQFALLSRSPAFPIAVPTCYFADFHHDSGTGILITERVAFGQGNIEPLYEKCLDYQIPDLLQHYQALVRALAHLAGTHRAGRLPDSVEQHFLFDTSKLAVSARAPYTAQQISNRVARYAEFAASYPHILPANIRSVEFLAQLADQAPRFIAHIPAATAILARQSAFIALCHWNANIDNGWYWRNAQNELECGLLDWGNVSQMNVSMALWGCLSAAETQIWNHHLDALLELFIHEFRNSGGHALDMAELKLHLLLYAAAMGLTWLLDAPAMILARIPDLSEVQSRFDKRFTNDETARAQLHFLTVFLNLWETQDMTQVLAILQRNAP